jgi:hypothetical protein
LSCISQEGFTAQFLGAHLVHVGGC